MPIKRIGDQIDVGCVYDLIITLYVILIQ